MELLTVLTLFSILLGIGVGSFRKISLGRVMAVSQVKDALRAARLFAIEQSSSARVDIDPQQNTIRATGFVSVGNWHFEDEISRGWPTNAALAGDAQIIEGGVIGRALALGPDAPGDADLGRSISFDADHGFLIEAFVKLQRASRGVIVSKGTAFQMGVTGTRHLFATVRVHDEEDGSDGKGTTLTLESTVSLPLSRWIRIALRLEGANVQLLVEGRLLAAQHNSTPWRSRPDPEASLVVGGREPAFVGMIDEVRLSSIVNRKSPPLPDGVTFASSGTIVFDGRGRLDAEHHSKPVTVRLLYDEGRRSNAVVVGLLGEIR